VVRGGENGVKRCGRGLKGEGEGGEEVVDGVKERGVL